MKQIAAIYSAELLKLKRSIAFKLVFLIPLLIVLLMLGTLLTNHPETYDLNMFNNMTQSVFISWLVLVLPMFLAIETGLISTNEQITTQWKHIYCLPLIREKILLAKWLVAETIMMAAQIILTVLFVLAFPVLRACLPHIDFTFFLSTQDFLTLFWQMCVSSLGIASLHFAFSLLIPGLIPAIGLGIAAVTFSIGIIYSGVGTDIFPWTLPMVAVSNCIPMDIIASIPKALAISLVICILSCLIAIPSFVRKDVL